MAEGLSGRDPSSGLTRRSERRLILKALSPASPPPRSGGPWLLLRHALIFWYSDVADQLAKHDRTVTDGHPSWRILPYQLGETPLVLAMRG
jgi:hypothetical protein